jgi:hypothetical protein
MCERPRPQRSGNSPDKADKAERLAAALRANLGRRKAQKRARSAQAAPGIAPEKNQG